MEVLRRNTYDATLLASCSSFLWPPLTHIAHLSPTPQDGNSVYDYKFETSSRSWKLWTDTIEKLAIPDSAQFSDIIIPTKDSAR